MPIPAGDGPTTTPGGTGSKKFPDNGSRYFRLPNGREASNVKAYVYQDTARTVAAEIYRDENGVKGSRILPDLQGRVFLVLDADGGQPDYWGPASGQDRLYLVVGGVRSGSDADYNARIDAIESALPGVGDIGGLPAEVTARIAGDVASVATAAADATTKASAAQAAAISAASSDATAKVVAHTSASDPHGDRADATTKANSAQAAAIAAAATDASSKASAAQSAATATALQRSSNLADLGNAATARANLGLGSASGASVGTTPGTVAAGDDTRIVGAAQKSANLSDLPSASTARANLGLGDSAVRNVGTGSTNVAAGDAPAAAQAAAVSAAATDATTKANAAQAAAVQRANHTGTQPLSSITGITELLVAGPGIDPSGTADSTTAIQALLTAAGVNSVTTFGQTVRFPAGKFKVSATLLSDLARGVDIVGAGRSATHLVATSALAGLPVIRMQDYYHCSIRDMTIQGVSGSEPYAGIDSHRERNNGVAPGQVCQKLHVENVEFSTVQRAMSWTVSGAGADGNNDQATIASCYAHLFTVAAYDIQGTNPVWLRFLGGEIAAGPIGWRLAGGSFNAFGTALVALTDVEVDVTAGTYLHPTTLSGVSSEQDTSGAKVLRTAAVSGFNIMYTGYERTQSVTNKVMVDFQATNYSSFGMVNCFTNFGQTLQQAVFADATSTARFIGCPGLAFNSYSYNGRLVLHNNRHIPGTVTLTNLGSGVLDQSGDVGGGFTASSPVQTTRSIATTGPLTGGGDLSVNRTLSVSGATTSAQGVVQLAGDLAGTATAPTVPGLATKIDKTALFVNVMDYGVTNTGLVDTTTALNAVFSALPAAAGNEIGGGEVFFPKGVYLCNTVDGGGVILKILNKRNVTLRGVGGASILRVSTAVADEFLRVDTCTDFHMEDLVIEVIGTANIGNALHYTTAPGTSVHDPIFKGVKIKANGSYRKANDITATSGSAVIYSAQAAFTSGDVGGNIALDLDAGPLYATIQSAATITATLAADITASATTVTLNAAMSGAPVSGFTIKIDTERMFVTAGGNTTSLTVTRGRGNNFYSAAHTTGASVTTSTATLSTTATNTTTNADVPARIQPSGSAIMRYGMAVGTDSPGASNMDLAGGRWFGLTIAKAAIGGVRVGNGTFGNILDHYCVGLSVTESGYGVIYDAAPFSIRSGEFAVNLVDIRRLFPCSAPFVIDDIRSENSSVFYNFTGAATSGPPTRLSDVTLNIVTAENGTVIRHLNSGSLDLHGITVRASDTGFGLVQVVAAGTAASPCHLYVSQFAHSGGNDDAFVVGEPTCVKTIVPGGKIHPVTGVVSKNDGLNFVMGRRVFITNQTAPSSTPTGGGFLYVETGSLKFKGSGGTVTVLGPA